jgi:hypothetical protein
MVWRRPSLGGVAILHFYGNERQIGLVVGAFRTTKPGSSDAVGGGELGARLLSMAWSKPTSSIRATSVSQALPAKSCASSSTPWRPTRQTGNQPGLVPPARREEVQQR